MGRHKIPQNKTQKDPFFKLNGQYVASVNATLFQAAKLNSKLSLLNYRVFSSIDEINAQNKTAPKPIVQPKPITTAANKNAIQQRNAGQNLGSNPMSGGVLDFTSQSMAKNERKMTMKVSEEETPITQQDYEDSESSDGESTAEGGQRQRRRRDLKQVKQKIGTPGRGRKPASVRKQNQLKLQNQQVTKKIEKQPESLKQCIHLLSILKGTEQMKILPQSILEDIIKIESKLHDRGFLNPQDFSVNVKRVFIDFQKSSTEQKHFSEIETLMNKFDGLLSEVNQEQPFISPEQIQKYQQSPQQKNLFGHTVQKQKPQKQQEKQNDSAQYHMMQNQIKSLQKDLSKLQTEQTQTILENAMPKSPQRPSSAYSADDYQDLSANQKQRKPPIGQQKRKGPTNQNNQQYMVTSKDLTAYVTTGNRDRPMTTDEAQHLFTLIRQLDPQKMTGIHQILRPGETQGVSLKSDNSMEFDIEELPVRKQRELEAYVKKCIHGPGQDQRKKKAAPRLNTKNISKLNAQNLSNIQGSSIPSQTVSQTAPPQPLKSDAGPSVVAELSDSSSSSSSSSSSQDSPEPEKTDQGPNMQAYWNKKS